MQFRPAKQVGVTYDADGLWDFLHIPAGRTVANGEGEGLCGRKIHDVGLYAGDEYDVDAEDFCPQCAEAHRRIWDALRALPPLWEDPVLREAGFRFKVVEE